MPRPAPTLLLTRPRAQSERFADAFSCRGGAQGIVIAPLMEIVPQTLDMNAVAEAKALIFTSENGVEGFVTQCARRDLTAYCVGPRTASAAAREGFNVVQAGGDAEALFALLQSVQPPQPLLHLRGTHAAGNLATRLNDAGLRTLEAVVYDQRARPLDRAAQALLESPGAVVLPLFSPRSARLLLEALSSVTLLAQLHPLAISPAAAEVWSASRPETPLIAARPDAEAMLDALAQWFPQTA